MNMKNFFAIVNFAICLLLGITSAAAFAQSMPATCEQDCPAPYVKNEFWTTEYGTASANIILTTTNFLSCSSSAYALCYYSGPTGTTTGKEGKTLPALPCKVSKNNPGFADCRCYAETGDSYVDIHSIANTEAYIETVRVCGTDGSKCRNMVSDTADKLAQKIGASPSTLPTAPVCSYLQANANGIAPMAPKAQLISTFSFSEAKHYGTTTKDCTAQPALYAGCMTASCVYELDKNKKTTGFALCKCPTYTGPFQIGPTDLSCDLGGNNVWSASYTPPSQ
jgi:hypothetical protein